MKGVVLAIALVVCAAPISGHAEVGNSPSTQVAQRKASPKKRPPSKKKRAPNKKSAKKKRPPKRDWEVPVQVGVGPSLLFVTGPVQDDQSPHLGVRLSVEAIIQRALIEANLHRIPKKYRGMAKKVDEARIRPLWFLPNSLYVSPKQERVGLYGASFRPLGIGLPFTRTPRISLGVGLLFTYLYVDGEDAGLGTTHFLRPGLEPVLDIEIPFSDSFLTSIGWASGFYPPQRLGGPVFEWGAVDASIWHIGQAYLKLAFRFPHSVRL
jgi:hypothetical protein